MLVFVLIIGSLWNYINCKNERPYYHETLSLIWNITSAVYLWVNVILLVSMIMQNTSYAGGLYLILIGTPAVFVAEYYCPHPKIYYVSKSISKFKSGTECTRFLRYLIDVIHGRSEKMNSILIKLSKNRNFVRRLY